MGRSESVRGEGTGGIPDVPVHDAVAALELIEAGAALLQGCGTATLSGDELRGVVERAARGRARLEAGYLNVLAALDRRDEGVPGARSGTGGASFLVHRLHYPPGAAAADVAAAQAVSVSGAATLPAMGGALAAGEVSRSHLEAAVRCLRRLPSHLLDRVDDEGATGRQRVDEFLTEQSRQHSPATTDRLAQQLLATLDPGGADRFDPAAHERRSLSLVSDSTGMSVIRGVLDPVAGATVRAALEVFLWQTADAGRSSTQSTPSGPDAPLPDGRTPGQRRADALRAVCAAALRGDPADGGRSGSPLARVLIVATPEQADAARRATPPPLGRDGAPSLPPAGSDPPGPAPGLATEVGSAPIQPGVLSRWLCDAEYQPVVLDPARRVLALGRSVRLATRAQRLALVARDRGCVVPDCWAPVAACEAHHVVWWRHGGGTDLDNLALLCGRHHTLIHTGRWQLQMIDGVPWVVAPSWVDPSRTPRRNAVFAAEDDARRLGHALGSRGQPPPSGAGDDQPAPTS